MSGYLSAQNESKLIIDASANQTNNQPLIRLRNSNGQDLLWIHSDNYSNTFIGGSAGTSNMAFSGGSGNTFLGYSAGYLNTTGGTNTATGTNALYNNTTGYSNTASGYNALAQNKAGSRNTACGYKALEYNITAEYNTALGYNAGTSFVNGWNNVFLGANTDVNAHGLFNVIAVGQGTTVTANSTARLGNSATASNGGWANWTNVSDGRYKKNIQHDVVGLDFILKLEPVTYNLDVSGISEALNESRGQPWDPQMQTAIVKKEQMIQSGFIAQEVEKTALEVGYHFSGVDAPKNENDMYGLRYAEFVVPLVKAVQELNGKVEDLELEIHNRKSDNEILAQRLEKLEALIGSHNQ